MVEGTQMTQNKKRYKAVIGDRAYTIIGKESKAHMDIVTALANNQLRDILNMSDTTTMEQAAILLAVNALSDQVKKESKVIEMEKEIQELNEAIEFLELEKSELTNQDEKIKTLESRLKRYDDLETEAKKALLTAGQEVEELSPMEAQQILNQQVKEKIQKNADVLSENDKS